MATWAWYAPPCHTSINCPTTLSRADYHLKVISEVNTFTTAPFRAQLLNGKNLCQQRCLDWGFLGPFVMQAGEIRSVLIGWIYPAHAYMEYQAPLLQREFSEGGNELLLALRQFLGFKPLHTWKTWTNVKHMKHCKRHYFISTVEALACHFGLYLFICVTMNVCGLFLNVHKHTTRVYSVLRDQKGASRSPISPGTLLSPPS